MDNQDNKITCPFCGKEVKSRDGFCEHCEGFIGKKKEPTQNKEIKKQTKICLSCKNEIDKNAFYCPICKKISGIGRINNIPTPTKRPITNPTSTKNNDDNTYLMNYNVARFLLTFFLGWIGSVVINHSHLKPAKHTSRSWAYFFLAFFTFGIYGTVASICNLVLAENKKNIIGYLNY